MNPFDSFDFDKANSAFTMLKTQLDNVAANVKFMAGDDWQEGAGWVGPQFTGQSSMSTKIKEAIKREFTSKSGIRGAVIRHRRGVIGRVPNWQVSSRKAPADGTKDAKPDPLIAEAQEALNEFWKNSRVHRTVKEALTDYLTTGHAVLRLFFVQSDTLRTEPVKTIADAVKKIHLFRELPETGLVIVDKATLKRASLYRYSQGSVTVIEMSYVNDAGNTVFKRFEKSGGKEFAEENFKSLSAYISDDDKAIAKEGVELPLNEKLLVFALDGTPFVTPAMRSQQKLLNKACTMLSHNLDVSGFRERIYLNALPPGEVKVDGAGNKVFVPNPDGVTTGAGSVSFTQGLQITERDIDTKKVKTTYTTPGVFESDPIPVKTYTDTIDASSAIILEEADQKHIAISGDAAASGESRKEARDGYKSSLEDTKSDTDDVMSEVLETVLAIVAYLMGDNDRFKDLQVTFNAILNPGPVSPDDRRVAIEEQEKGVRSLESAMEEAGITDPDAMKAKISEETADVPALDKVLDVLNKANGKLPMLLQMKLLAKALRIPEAEAEQMLKDLAAEAAPVVEEEVPVEQV